MTAPTTTETAIQVVHWREAWYARDQVKGWGDWLDEIMINVVDAEHPEQGCIGGEVAVRWYALASGLAARLEVFDDGWIHLGCDGPLHELVGLLAGWTEHADVLGPLTPAALRYILCAGNLQATDATPRTIPTPEPVLA